MNDQTFGGEWYYCTSCKISGDNFDIWQLGSGLPPVEAAFRAAELRLMADRPSYADIDEHTAQVNERNANLEVLRESQDYMRSTSSLARIFPFIDAKNSDWPERCGKFVGALSRMRLAEVVVPRRLDNISTSLRRSMFGKQHLKPEWNEVLIIPFWDMPGRLSAVTGTTYDGQQFYTRYIAAPFNKKPGSGLRTGAAMLQVGLDPAIRPFAKPFGAILVAIDPLMALEQHARQFQTSDEILPLVTVYPTARAFQFKQVFDNRPIVFVGRENHELPLLFKCARELDTRIAVIETDHVAGPTRHYMTTDKTCRAWMEYELQFAKPWADVLEQQLAKMQATEAGPFLEKVGFTQDAASAFIRGCPATLRNRLTFLTTESKTKSTKIGTIEIVETEAGWRIAKTKELICNASFRIDELVYMQSTGKTLASGVIRFNGEDIPFSAPYSSFDLAPFRWFKHYLLKLGKGVLSFHSSWQKHAIHISENFHKPVSRSVAGTYGWDEPNKNWLFPHWTIEDGGKVVEHSVTDFETPFRPCHVIAKPRKFTIQELLDLGDMNSVGFWKLTGAVLANLLAKRYSAKPTGIGLIGWKLQSTLPLLEQLGCALIKRGNPRKWHRSPDRWHEYELAEQWPLAMEQLVRGQRWWDWIAQPEHNCIACFIPLQGRLAALTYGWTLIQEPLWDRVMHYSEFARFVVPSVLQWIEGSNKKIKLHSRGMFDWAFEILREWFTAEGGNPVAINYAALDIDETNSPGMKFGYALQAALKRNLLITTTEGVDEAAGTLVLTRNQKIWLAEADLRTAIIKSRSPRIPEELVTKELEAAKVLSERIRMGERGWLFDEKWFSSCKRRIANDEE
jgi:hypothetical protein